MFFLGFFGSNTFFNHIHVVDGIKIVHSHPYKTGSNGSPSHSHSENGYVIIQFLSVIPILFTISYFVFKPIAPFLYELVQKASEGAKVNIFYSLPLLRAPPLDMLKINLLTAPCLCF